MLKRRRRKERKEKEERREERKKEEPVSPFGFSSIVAAAIANSCLHLKREKKNKAKYSMIAEGPSLEEINALFCDCVGLNEGPFSFTKYKDQLNELMKSGQAQWSHFRLPQKILSTASLDSDDMPQTPEGFLVSIYLKFWGTALRKYIDSEVKSKYSASSIITDENLYFLYDTTLLRTYLIRRRGMFKEQAKASIGSPELSYIEKPLLQKIDSDFEALAGKLTFDKYMVISHQPTPVPIITRISDALRESSPMVCFNGSTTLSTIFYKEADRDSILSFAMKKLGAKTLKEGSTPSDVKIVTGVGRLSGYTEIMEYLKGLYNESDCSNVPIWIIQSRGEDVQTNNFYVALDTQTHKRISSSESFVKYFSTMGPRPDFGNLFTEKFVELKLDAFAPRPAQRMGGSSTSSPNGSGFDTSQVRMPTASGSSGGPPPPMSNNNNNNVVLLSQNQNISNPSSRNSSNNLHYQPVFQPPPGYQSQQFPRQQSPLTLQQQQQYIQQQQYLQLQQQQQQQYLQLQQQQQQQQQPQIIITNPYGNSQQQQQYAQQYVRAVPSAANPQQISYVINPGYQYVMAQNVSPGSSYSGGYPPNYVHQ